MSIPRLSFLNPFLPQKKSKKQANCPFCNRAFDDVSSHIEECNGIIIKSQASILSPLNSGGVDAIFAEKEKNLPLPTAPEVPQQAKPLPSPFPFPVPTIPAPLPKAEKKAASAEKERKAQEEEEEEEAPEKEMKKQEEKEQRKEKKTKRERKEAQEEAQSKPTSQADPEDEDDSSITSDPNRSNDQLEQATDEDDENVPPKQTESPVEEGSASSDLSNNEKVNQKEEAQEQKQESEDQGDEVKGEKEGSEQQSIQRSHSSTLVCISPRSSSQDFQRVSILTLPPPPSSMLRPSQTLPPAGITAAQDAEENTSVDSSNSPPQSPQDSEENSPEGVGKRPANWGVKPSQDTRRVLSGNRSLSLASRNSEDFSMDPTSPHAQPSELPPPSPKTVHSNSIKVEGKLGYCLFDYEKKNEGEIELTEGDYIYILEKHGEWLFVKKADQFGYVAANYIEELDNASAANDATTDSQVSAELSTPNTASSSSSPSSSPSPPSSSAVPIVISSSFEKTLDDCVNSNSPISPRSSSTSLLSSSPSALSSSPSSISSISRKKDKDKLKKNTGLSFRGLSKRKKEESQMEFTITRTDSVVVPSPDPPALGSSPARPSSDVDPQGLFFLV